MDKRPGATIRFKLTNRERMIQIAKKTVGSENAFIDHCMAGVMEMIDAPTEPLPVPHIVQLARAKLGHTLPAGEVGPVYEAIERMETRLMEKIDQIDRKVQAANSRPAEYRVKRRTG